MIQTPSSNDATNTKPRAPKRPSQADENRSYIRQIADQVFPQMTPNMKDAVRYPIT